jgi:hypothetical protein
MSTGRADLPPLEACSVADYGNSFNPDSQRTNSRPTKAARDPPLVIDENTGALAAQLETERLRIINTPMARS